MKTFEELGVSEEIRRAIEELGFENPMPVQEEVIPYLLGNKNDVIALAQTGTGKTASYGIPVIQKTDASSKQTQAIILSPTRELCLQIADDLNSFAKYINGLHIVAVYGGTDIGSQIRTLKHGVQIIVATPGRLLDLINRGVAQLENVNNVVLDEADEMLNMGFIEDINSILASVPSERNTMLFSATMPEEIGELSLKYMKQPREIVIGRRNEGTASVRHVCYTVHARDKYRTLKRIADFYPRIYGIIFCRTKAETQEISERLIRDGYNVDALHGDLSQQQRDYVMNRFRLHNIQLLVATDVAARGIDVDDLTHIINYSLPDETEVYTHRSGRTGRAGKTGISIAIINMKEVGRIKAIEKIIGKKFEIGKIPSGNEICKKQIFNLIDRIEKVEVNEDEVAEILPSVYSRLQWLDKEELVKRLVSLEFSRLIDYYQEDEDFDAGNHTETRKDRVRKTSGQAPESFSKLFLNLGKMDGLNPQKLLMMVNRTVPDDVEIGRIDLFSRHSVFEVQSDMARSVIDGLMTLKRNGRQIKVDYATEEQVARQLERKKQRKESRSASRKDRSVSGKADQVAARK